MTQMLSPNGTPASRLIFGTMQWGGGADAQASRAMYDTCRDAGLTHFDTAYLYTDGASETLLGDFIKADRDDLIIATKVAYEGGAGRANILRQFDISRSRLQIETIDLLYIHRFDPDTPLEETFDTLAGLQTVGKVRSLGVSNFAAWQVIKAQGIASRLGTQIDVIQPMYSLVKRQAEVEIFPMAQDQDIAICPYSPLGGGLLTGKYTKGETGRLTDDPRYTARYDVDWMRSAAAGLTQIATREGVHPATLAVAWVARQEAGPSPIISAKSTAQLAPSLAAGAYELSDALYAEITALSETPAPATDRLEEA